MLDFKRLSPEGNDVIWNLIMAINIPTKSEKRASELRDGVRLLAWESYKIENSLKGQKAFDGYECFNDEWKEHEIHGFNLVAVEKFIKSLGYTPEEVLALRSEVYERKAKMNGQKSTISTSTISTFDEAPY